MAHSHPKHDHDGCCVTACLRQTLQEIEFERGIWYAAQCNDMNRVKTLLENGVSANAEDSAGYRALHYAARNAHYYMCEMLLLHDADVNARTRCGRATALHRAATQGHANIVHLLLKFGANPNLIDGDDDTALHRALMVSARAVCELLLPCTDLDFVNGTGRSLRQLVITTYGRMFPRYVTEDEESSDD